MSIKTKVKLSKNWKDIALPSTHESVEKRFNGHTWYLLSYDKTRAVLTNDIVKYVCNINLIETV